MIFCDAMINSPVKFINNWWWWFLCNDEKAINGWSFEFHVGFIEIGVGYQNSVDFDRFTMISLVFLQEMCLLKFLVECLEYIFPMIDHFSVNILDPEWVMPEDHHKLFQGIR